MLQIVKKVSYNLNTNRVFTAPKWKRRGSALNSTGMTDVVQKRPQADCKTLFGSSQKAPPQPPPPALVASNLPATPF